MKKAEPKAAGWVCHAPERGMFHHIHPDVEKATDEAMRISEKEQVDVRIYRLVPEWTVTRYVNYKIVKP